MSRQLPRLFWLEAVTAALCLALLVLTLFTREWIEAFGFAPDGGSGAAEWATVAAFGGVALDAGIVGTRTYVRSAPAAP